MGYSQRLVGAPFVISKKAVAVLQEFNIQEYFLYPMHLYNSEGSSIKDDYFLFYCPLKEFDILDVKNCIIYTGSDLVGNKKYYSFSSLEEYLEFNKKSPLYHFETIAIKSNPQLDLYQIRADSGVFISDRLKEAIEKNKLTALEFSKKVNLRVNI